LNVGIDRRRRDRVGEREGEEVRGRERELETDPIRKPRVFQ
jgi:hypothetical protein